MPALQVLVDQQLVATVATTGLDVLAVHVGGALTEDGFASLRVDGGHYPEVGDSTHLVWVNEAPLRPGQRVVVHLTESGDTYPPGKTLEELFPGEIEQPEVLMSHAEVFAELRGKSLARAAYRFSGVAIGEPFIGGTVPGDHGFGFTVVWNSQRPERARSSLHAYTIANLEDRTPMRYLMECKLEVGQSAEISVDA
jgi:hypothetical protein